MGNKDLQEISKVAKIIGSKWTILILNSLLGGTKRFGELERSVGDINPKTLSKRLQQLEKEGYIQKKVYASVPPKVEYSLTPKGHIFKQVIKSVRTCGEKI